MLQILWEEERKSLNLKHKQRFADLGCGNGLLVHILNEEGVNMSFLTTAYYLQLLLHLHVNEYYIN